MARILAIDYGLKRTGLAVTDELQIIASGLTTVNSKELLAFLKDYVSKETVELFIVGEPKQMDNTASESEVLIVPFLKKLEAQFPKIPIKRVELGYTHCTECSTIDAYGTVGITYHKTGNTLQHVDRYIHIYLFTS